MKEKNKYKNINAYNYYTTDRLYNILKLDLKTIKQYINNNLLLRSDEIVDLIYEIEMVIYIIRLRHFKVLNEK